MPLHLSLTQPVLFAGVPRSVGIGNMVFTLMTTLGLKVWWLGLPLGLAVHFIALALTRLDPLWADVLRRHLKQPTYLDG